MPRGLSAGGASWQLLDRIYVHGAGYSDLHLMHTAGGEPYLGALFQRTLYEPGAEGGGYAAALCPPSLASGNLCCLWPPLPHA